MTGRSSPSLPEPGAPLGFYGVVLGCEPSGLAAFFCGVSADAASCINWAAMSLRPMAASPRVQDTVRAGEFDPNFTTR